MKKVVVLSLLFTLIFQLKSQNVEVEIYIVQSNTVVKGTVVANSIDSLRVRVDSLHTLTFAKSELEGRELPVSKEVMKFRKKLLRKEAIMAKGLNQFPGVYQMRNGEKTKGKIMVVLASIGIVGVIASGGVLVIGLATSQGLWAFITLSVTSLLIFAPSIAFIGVSSGWSTGDRFNHIKKNVNNRYYYGGASLLKMNDE